MEVLVRGEGRLRGEGKGRDLDFCLFKSERDDLVVGKRGGGCRSIFEGQGASRDWSVSQRNRNGLGKGCHC